MKVDSGLQSRSLIKVAVVGMGSELTDLHLEDMLAGQGLLALGIG